MRLYGALQELTSLVIRLASGKTVKIQAAEQAAAGETTITIPDVVDGADTVVLVDTQQTLTNKTLTAPTMTNAAINSTTKVVIPSQNSPTHTAAGSLIWDGNDSLLTVGSDNLGGFKTMVDEGSSQTLFNKTISGGSLSNGTVSGGAVGVVGNPTSINNINKLALADIGANVGANHVVITDANKEVRTEATLSKARGGTGVDLSNVDFPQNVTSKIVTNIAELTSVKLDRAAPSIVTSVLTPSANKAVVQRITTAANFNEIANPEDGRYYIIMNASATDITIGNETGTAANQIITGTGAAFTFKAGTSIAAVYDGGSSKWRLSGGAGGAGGGTTDVITQVAHGFAVGDAVYLNGLVYTHAIATAANTAEVVGVVSKVVSNDAFELTLSGEISGLSGLTPGEVYFLGVDPLNPGKLTIVEPSVVGQVSLPVGVASSASTLYVAPKRGVVVGAANARTTIAVANAGVTPVVNVTNYNSLKLEGELFVNRVAGNQRAYYTVEATKNGAGTWQVSASYTGDDMLYTTLPSWDVAANQLQLTMPLVTGTFNSASLTYSLNAPAVGASLPLAIDSSSLNIVADAPLSYRNRIINGDMRIDQRNAGAAVLNVNGYTVDRFTAGYYGGATGRFTAERSTTAPAGFTNSLLLTTTTAQAVLGANDAFAIRQAIEGFNVADLFFGESSAQTVTLSFWVRSSQTGTFSVLLLNAAGDRCYGGLVTINAANTFEYKTVTIPGDTTGTWLKDSSAGIQVYFGLGAGSTRTVAAGWSNGAGGATPGAVTGQTINICASVGANFRVTGVQLEVGSKASAFERRPYSEELARCLRYCFVGGLFGVKTETGWAVFPRLENKNMRILPVITLSRVYNGASGLDITGYGPFVITNWGTYSLMSSATNSGGTGAWVMVDCILNSEL